MKIKGIAKAFASEIMNTKEYGTMISAKNKLNSNKELGKLNKEYQTKQIEIMSSKSPQNKKQQKLLALNNQYKSLLNSKEMKEYMKTASTFQKKMVSIYDELNKETAAIISG